VPRGTSCRRPGRRSDRPSTRSGKSPRSIGASRGEQVTLLVAAMAMVMGVASGPVLWPLADPIAHVFDVAGPRSDGRLVVAAGGKLFFMDQATGALNRFAGGPDGYRGAGGEEPYIAVVSGAVAGHTNFRADDVFVLQLRPTGGILRIDSEGIAHPFANVAGVDLMNGITFDETGAFGYRLLVTGAHAHHSTVVAIDGDGQVTVITAQAPTVEGGLAVAPSTFGRFAGDLIAPDELSGKIYAIAPDGSSQLVATPALAHGGDVGVEAAGFIPDIELARATVYFADRATPGNLHPGTDNLLALNGTELARAGGAAGDLLVGTEGGAGLVAVRCDLTTCRVTSIIADNGTSHGEGHIVVAMGTASKAFGPAPAAVRSSTPPTPAALELGSIAAALIAVVLTLTLAVTMRRRRAA
jgi:hypothetical protein